MTPFPRTQPNISKLLRRSRGSPPPPVESPPLGPPKGETGVAYAIFRKCGVPVEEGEDLKACLERVLATAPLALLDRCIDPKTISRMRYALQCERQDALLELYVELRCGGKRDYLLAWDPNLGGLVWWIRRGLRFAASSICGRVERAPWGVTVSLEEWSLDSDGDFAAQGNRVPWEDRLAARPEPGVSVCARY